MFIRLRQSQSKLFGTSTSTLAAPGAEIKGIEAEITWLATDRLTLGGNFSFTPNEVFRRFGNVRSGWFDRPETLFGTFGQLKNINGNQLLQVPEG